MKLIDIAWDSLGNRLDRSLPKYNSPPAVVTEIAVEKEIEELMRADASGLVASCRLLEVDELALADFILDRLSANPNYRPGPLVWQAIRAINARIQMSLP